CSMCSVRIAGSSSKFPREIWAERADSARGALSGSLLHACPRAAENNASASGRTQRGTGDLCGVCMLAWARVRRPDVALFEPDALVRAALGVEEQADERAVEQQRDDHREVDDLGAEHGDE